MFTDELKALHKEEVKYYSGFAYKEKKMEKEIVNRLIAMGVIKSKLTDLMDHPLFDVMEGHGIRRPKDACGIFDELDEERQCDMIHELAYAIDSIREDIADCLEIAEGEDE